MYLWVTVKMGILERFYYYVWSEHTKALRKFLLNSYFLRHTHSGLCIDIMSNAIEVSVQDVEIRINTFICGSL